MFLFRTIHIDIIILYIVGIWSSWERKKRTKTEKRAIIINCFAFECFNKVEQFFVFVMFYVWQGIFLHFHFIYWYLKVCKGGGRGFFGMGTLKRTFVLRSSFLLFNSTLNLLFPCLSLAKAPLFLFIKTIFFLTFPSKFPRRMAK